MAIDEELDAKFMRMALDAANAAANGGEAPIGAVIVSADNEVLAVAGNTPIAACDPTAHAEICAIRVAGERLNNYRLTGTTLYVTLEPCVMCAGAISHARIERLVFAADDPKGGGVVHGPCFFEQSTCHWRPIVQRGPFATEAGDLLRDFFRLRREKKPKHGTEDDPASK